MSSDVIKSIDQLNPEWLTNILLRSGALTSGAVKGIETISNLDRELSSSVRLRVHYETHSSGELPTRLFLKVVDTRYDGDDDPLQTSEVDYYSKDYVGVDGVPLLRCYGSGVSEDSRYYFVLLEDVSETHVGAHEKPVTLEYGLALAECMAAMHAQWWGAVRLKEAGQPIHSSAVIQNFVDIAQPGVSHILGCCSSELKEHWPQVMYDIYELHPALLLDRCENANGFTLIHGDPNPTNILVPSAGVTPVYVIDRGPFEWSLTTWLAVYDLSYAMVLSWEPDFRRETESTILQHYHDCLVQRGITDYPMQQLWDDYRLMVPMNVYIATEYFRGSAGLRNKRIWMPKLQKALTAFDDLDCAQMLGRSTL